MDRKRNMGADTLKDYTIEFLSWMNEHKQWMTATEKKEFSEGFERALHDEPIEKLLNSIKRTILDWISEWKGKKNTENDGPERRIVILEFPNILKKYYEALSLCYIRELSGVEEKGINEIRDYFRSQIEALGGNTLEMSEDLRG